MEWYKYHLKKENSLNWVRNPWPMDFWNWPIKDKGVISTEMENKRDQTYTLAKCF